MDNISIAEWQNSFLNGEFDNPNVRTQIKAGWYDWFCKDTSLANKTKKMGNIIVKINCGGKVDLNNWYVWFKNNCPIMGPLYDDFRFADRETGDVQFTIVCNDKRTNHRYEVWGRHNNFEGPIIGFDSSRELVKWLNKPWEE